MVRQRTGSRLICHIGGINRRMARVALRRGARLLCYQPEHVRFPGGERVAHLIDVLKAVIDGGDAAEGAGDVVQDAFDNVGQDAELAMRVAAVLVRLPLPSVPLRGGPVGP